MMKAVTECNFQPDEVSNAGIVQMFENYHLYSIYYKTKEVFMIPVCYIYNYYTYNTYLVPIH